MTETDGKHSGIVGAPRLAGVGVATAATPGTAVASEVTLSVSAPPSVVGVILTPPAAEAVAESVPATPLPPADRSCSSGTLLSSARNRSGAAGAAPSSDDTSLMRNLYPCRAYIFPSVKNVPVDVSAHAQ